MYGFLFFHDLGFLGFLGGVADRVLRFVDVCKLLFVGCVCAVVAAIGLQEQIWIAAAIVHSMLWYVV